MRISSPGKLLRLASVLATAQLLLAAIVLGAHGTPGALGGDFIAYYSAGKQALAGGGRHMYELPVQLIYQQPLLLTSGLAAGGPSMIPFDYPPLVALLFLPLAALPAGVATLVWLAINAAIALVAWRVMLRQDRPGLGTTDVQTGAGRPQRAAPAMLAVFLLFPLDWGLLSGQPVGLILLLAALSFRSLLRRQDVSAGIWLGAIALFKPQLLVVPLLGLVVLRRPRAVLGTALAGAALLATSLILVGFQGLLAYVQLLRQIDPALGNSALSVRAGAMINWRAWITAIPGMSSNAALALTAAAAVVTVSAALICCRRQAGDADVAWSYLGFNASGLLAGYHSHYQDLVMLLPPAVILVAGWMQRSGHANSPVNAEHLPDDAISPPPVDGRDHPSKATLGNLVPPAAALLLVIGPGLSWLIFGIFALSWLPTLTFLAVPGLLLLLVAGRRHSAASPVTASLPTAHDISMVKRVTAVPGAALAAPFPVSRES